MKQDSKIIYIACPYSGPYSGYAYSDRNEEIEIKRYRTATQIAMQLTRGGYRVFSPVTHAHPICLRDPRVPQTWEFWKELNKPVLEISGLLLVLMLDGWDKSIGVTEEIQIAQDSGIPIIYADYAGLPVVEDLVEKLDTLGVLKEKKNED
jgi:hypothetical protein